MNRKLFLKTSVPAFLLLANGDLLHANQYIDFKRKKKLRFAICSDGHYGQPGTDYESYFATLVSKINQTHAKDPFAFCMVNGDIIHDDPVHYPAAKAALDRLAMKYYVTQGNHDKVTSVQWEKIWNMPVNYSFVSNGTGFLAATTSNEKGEYLCADLAFMQKELEAKKHMENVFIFIHINPAKLTKFGIDCPEFLELLSKYKNVRAVFNGHDHDEDGIKVKNNIPFVFDAHAGGDWGTQYRGFRIVELQKDNSILTYIMNPDEKINDASITSQLIG